MALNARPMKSYGGLSRRDLFERYDRPALQPLPAEPLCLRRLAPGPRQHRLPRRGRPPLLLGAVRADPRGARRAARGADRRDLSARHARVAACPELPARAPHDRAGAHAEGASGAPGMDALAPVPLGRDHRARHRGADPAHPREPPASRAGLPLLPRPAAPDEALRPGAPRGRLRPGAGRRRHARIAMSRPSSSTASIASPRRAAPDAGAPARSRMTTSAAPRTTRTETPHDHDDPRSPPRPAPRRLGRRLPRPTARRRPCRASASTSASACSSMPSISFATIARWRVV